MSEKISIAIMKPKYKLGPIILKIFILLLGIAFAVFSIMMLKVIIINFKFVGVFVFIMISWFASIFLLYGINVLKSITIDLNNKTIELSYLGLFKKQYNISSIKGFCNYPYINRLNIYEGILIEFENGRQFQMNTFEISNFKELQLEISRFVKQRKDLKIKIWNDFY